MELPRDSSRGNPGGFSRKVHREIPREIPRVISREFAGEFRREQGGQNKECRGYPHSGSLRRDPENYNFHAIHKET